MNSMGRIRPLGVAACLLAVALIAAPSSSVIAQHAAKPDAKPRAAAASKVPAKKPVAKLPAQKKQAAAKRAKSTKSARATVARPARQLVSARQAPIVDDLWAIRALERELLRAVGRFTQPEDYPKEALHAGWTGTAVVQVFIEADGTFRSVQLRDSSGFAVLDDQAVRMVQRVERMRVPAAYRGRTPALTVPIGFHVRAAQPISE